MDTQPRTYIIANPDGAEIYTYPGGIVYRRIPPNEEVEVLEVKQTGGAYWYRTADGWIRALDLRIATIGTRPAAARRMLLAILETMKKLIENAEEILR